MKKVYYSLLMVALVAVAASCNNVSYKKTQTGLLYKIVSSGKDSLVKDGEWLKLNFVQKINDSMVQTSYGKMPIYIKVNSQQKAEYSPAEIFSLLRKGDSVTTVMMVDSLLSKKIMPELPPNMKKTDRITTTFRITDIIRSDSAYQVDAKAEYDKDLPRQKKEQEAQMEKMKKEMAEAQAKEELELEKSGEAAKGIKAAEDYLASKGIKAEKVGKGTFVVVKEKGTGAPVQLNKYIEVKYSGKTMRSDSLFDSGVYPLQLGVDPVIPGWVEGLQAFNAGGKGVLYIPGFRAYGARPRPGSGFQPFEALYFDVEILQVSDKPIERVAPPPPPQPRK